ncbi:MAG: single-stranded DNA-binding protein [Bacteroidia bacterium]|jgi:single-strand DNA-binding protein|nr:single-stranded DNA-binding protein [Bacteroidia bacterium]
MNNLRNSVRLIGHLGQSPELKELKSGKKLAKFSVAINESYRNESGEQVKDTQWHNITAWGKQAELAAKILTKGSEVVIDGKLTNNTYTDKEGVKRYSTEIVLNEFVLVGKKRTD